MPVFSRVYRTPAGHVDPNQLQLAGPSLPVEISVSSRIAALLTSQGTPLPQPQTGLGLLDTGASITAIDQNVANALQLAPISVTTVGTPGGQQQQPVYGCQISGSLQLRVGS